MFLAKSHGETVTQDPQTLFVSANHVEVMYTGLIHHPFKGILFL